MEKRNQKKKGIPGWLWVLVCLGFLAALLAFLKWAPDDKKNFIDMAGLFSAYITVCGFSLTLWQISALKSTSEATENAIAETRNDIKRVSTVSDISKYLTIIRQIKEYVKEDKYDIAQLRLYELKDFLLAMEQEKGLKVNLDDVRAIRKNAQNQLTAVDNKLVNNMDIKKDYFSKAMEEIASGLVGIKTNL